MKTRPYVQGEKLEFGECITQGNIVCNYEELSQLAKDAEKLAVGLNLVRSEERSWYGEDYTVYGPDWNGIALLIDRLEKKRE